MQFSPLFLDLEFDDVSSSGTTRICSFPVSSYTAYWSPLASGGWSHGFLDIQFKVPRAGVGYQQEKESGSFVFQVDVGEV